MLVYMYNGHVLVLCVHLLYFSQATLTDKAVGSLLILAALTIFLYYTVWVIFLVSHHAAVWLACNDVSMRVVT